MMIQDDYRARRRMWRQPPDPPNESTQVLKATNEQQATATVSTASESTADDKMQSTPSTTATITAKPSAAPVTLRNYPSIVVQQLAKPKSTTGKSSNRANDQLRLHSSDLDTIFAASKQGADFETYELALCAQTLLDLIRRDAIFILFRSLVTAGDRGVHTKASHRYGDLMYHSVTPVDLPLLFACVLLDGDGKNFFSRNEVEEMVRSLGLPISRYQIRSLLAKVADGRRVYYRCLTHSDKRHQQHHQSSDSDTSTSTATSKPSGDQQQPTVTSVQQAAYSEIDDDEYLLELVRGGDAVLPAPMEDDRASTIPSGSILVLHQDRKGSSDNDTVELIQVSGGDGPTDDNLVDLTNQVRKFEDEKNKLRGQLVKKEADIAALNKSLDKMADLKTKLSDANHQVDSYRRRLRRYKDEASTLDRQLESQAAILDSCRSVIRQSAKSLRQPAESQWSAGGSGTSSSSMKRSLRSISPESSSGDAKRVKESVKKEEEHAEKSKIEVPQNGTDESSVDNSVPMIVDQ